MSDFSIHRLRDFIITLFNQSSLRDIKGRKKTHKQNIQGRVPPPLVHPFSTLGPPL